MKIELSERELSLILDSLNHYAALTLNNNEQLSERLDNLFDLLESRCDP